MTNLKQRQRRVPDLIARAEKAERELAALQGGMDANVSLFDEWVDRCGKAEATIARIEALVAEWRKEWGHLAAPGWADELEAVLKENAK